MDLAKLVVRLEAQSAQLLKELDKANGKLAKFERDTGNVLNRIDKKFSRFGFGLKAAVGTFLAGFSFNAVIAATSEAEKNFGQLQNAVERAGAAAGGRTADDFARVATELENITTASDDSIQNVQQLLLRFQNIRTDRFDDATKSVLNLSQALGKDLDSAATLVGKALSNPEKGLAGLAKAGVAFSDAQTKIIKGLVDTGQRAQAQGIILDALEKKFGGAAETARTTFGGALKAVQNQIGNLLEVKGGLPGATQSLNDFAKVLQDPAVKAGADALFSLIIRLAAEAASLIGKIAAGIAVIFNKTGDRVEELTKNITFLKEQRDSFAPLVFNFGNKSDVNPEGGFGVLTPAEIDKQIAKLELEQEALLKIGVGGMRAADAVNALGKAHGIPTELPDIEVFQSLGEEAEKAQKKIEAAGKAMTEKFMDPVERFNKFEAEANKLLDAGVINLETWAKAMAGARHELDEMNMSLGEFRSTELVNQLRPEDIKLHFLPGNLDEIDKSIQETADKAGKILDEGQKKAQKQLDAFSERASQNVQDILANGISTALHDGFSKGAKGALQAFGDMLEQMAIQAIAADLAGKLFGEDGFGSLFKTAPKGGSSSSIAEGENGILGSIFGSGSGGGFLGFLGGLFGGSRDSGGRGRRGEPVLIGRRAQPEMFVPDEPGEFYPAGQWPGGGGGNVTQNIYTASPITQRSARQTQLEAARAQRTAVARLT